MKQNTMTPMSNNGSESKEGNIPFERALRKSAGGRSVCERHRLFRGWWQHAQEEKQKQLPPDVPRSDNTVAMFEHFKEHGVSPDWLVAMEKGIPAYREKEIKANKGKAARAMWTKKKLGQSKKPSK
jgi:hypothetical protein